MRELSSKIWMSGVSFGRFFRVVKPVQFLLLSRVWPLPRSRRGTLGTPRTQITFWTLFFAKICPVSSHRKYLVKRRESLRWQIVFSDLFEQDAFFESIFCLTPADRPAQIKMVPTHQNLQKGQHKAFLWIFRKVPISPIFTLSISFV